MEHFSYGKLRECMVISTAFGSAIKAGRELAG